MSKNTDFGLKNKPLALVTGGARRVGKAISFHLAELGFDLQIWCNSSLDSALNLKKELWQKFQCEVEIVGCDLSNENSIIQQAEKFIRKNPRLTLLVNNASIFYPSHFLQAPLSELKKNFEINFFSPMLLAYEFAQNFMEQNLENGQIINLLDKNITRFDTSYFHYLLSKKTLAQSTQILALQLAPKIRVNAIAPSLVSIPEDQVETPEKLQYLAELNPLRSVCEIDDINSAISFLLLNRFVNGQILFVDGASSLNHGGQ